MAVKTAQQALDNYVRGMGQAGPAYIQGINGFNGNPMALAATDAALASYAQACQQSVTSGHRARRLLAASPAVWKNNAVTIGAGNLATGAQKAKAKLLPILTALSAVWQAQNQLKTTMPGKDHGSGKARMNAAFDLMVGFRAANP